MSFVKVQDIQNIIEGMVTTIWDKALGKKLTKASFPHMTYHEAMSKVEINELIQYLACTYGTFV